MDSNAPTESGLSSQQNDEEDIIKELESIDHSEFSLTAEVSFIGVGEQRPGTPHPSASTPNNSAQSHLKYQAHSTSPPRDIIQKPEKVAELFPSDSDSSFSEVFRWSRSTSASGLFLSRAHSACSFPSNGSHLASPDLSIHSVDFIQELTKKNSERIEKIHKGHCKQSVKMHRLHSESKEEIKSSKEEIRALKERVQQLEDIINRQERMKLWMRPNVDVDKNQQQEASEGFGLQFDVPYTMYASQKEYTFCVPTIEAPYHLLLGELHLRGIGNGHGSHLSLSFTEISGHIQVMDCTVKVSVINHEDPSETISKDAQYSVPSHSTIVIPKLIPISTVEDPALHYLVNGQLTLRITVEALLPS